MDHFVSTNAPVDVPFTGATPPRAIQVNGTSQTVFSGSWVDAGLAVIPNVPTGRLMVNYAGTSWVDTTASTIDIGADVAGRSNVAVGATNTTVLVQLTNLSAWQPGFDSLEYLVPNHGSDYFLRDADAGSTTYDAGYNFTNFELMNASQGDVLTLSQLRYEVVNAPGTDAGFVYSGRSERYVQLPNITYTSAAANTVAAMMTPITRNQTATLDWRRGELANLRPLVHPNAVVRGTELNVIELLFGAQAGHGLANVGGFITVDNVLAPTGDFTTTTAQIAWGAFNATFPVAGETFFSYSIDAGATDVVAGVYSSNSMPAFTQSPQRQIILPVTNLTVGGAAAQGPVTLSTLTPVIAWSAPTGAIAYYVNIMRATAGTPSVAVVLTNATQITVPTGAITGGNQRYVVRVRALTEPTGDPVNAPFRKGSFPFGYADALSGIITAP